jgi:hypothetical protein
MTPDDVARRVVEFERVADHCLAAITHGVTPEDAANAVHQRIAAALTHATQEQAREIERLRESLDILTRACEAGAYVGRTSPAVTQARALLTPERPR